MTERDPARVLILALFAADILLCAAYLLNTLGGLNSGMPSKMFDMNGEGNLPAWYSSAQLLVIALMLGAFTWTGLKRTRPEFWLLGILALGFLAMSADEVAGIHESLGRRSDVLLPGGDRANTPFTRTGIWMIVIGIPIVAMATTALFALRTFFRKTPGVMGKYVVGGVMFFGGAVGVEFLGNFLEEGSRALILQIAVEEVLELLGVTTLLWATWDLLRGNRGRLTFDTDDSRA